MKKLYTLVLLTLFLAACGQMKPAPAKPYQIKANSILYKNTAIVVNVDVYLDRADINLSSSTANAYLEKGVDYLDDSQFAKFDISTDLDVNNDIESISVEFPEAKNLQVKPAFTTGGGAGSVIAVVTWSAEFVSPPKQFQDVYVVVKIKFKQFEEPVPFEFIQMADVAPEVQP